MIGETYQAKAIGAVLGSAHSTLFPEILWGAWLDDAMDVITETGTQVDHDAFDLNDTGVENIEVVDAGTLPADAVWFALMDAETDGAIVLAALVSTTLDVGDVVAFPPGTLVFPYGCES